MALAACGAPASDGNDATPAAGGASVAAPAPDAAGSTSAEARPEPEAAAPSAPAPAPAPPAPMALLLEDFEGAAPAGFAQAWRTYSDGTGTVTPEVGAEVIPEAGVVRVSGSNFSTWGVGLSVDLDSSGGSRQPVDLGAYSGITVRARGSGAIEVELVLPGTTGTSEPGGTCSADPGCFGHYAASLQLGADFTDQTLLFRDFRQPDWAAASPLDASAVLAINFLSRVSEGPVGIDLYLDALSLEPAAPAVEPGAGPASLGPATVADGSNPFAGRTLHSEGGAARAAYEAAQGADRDLLAKIALNPAAYWLVGGDPTRAGGIVDQGGDQYSVLVVYNIPNRDCNGESAGGAGSPDEYRGWIDAMASSLAGKEAAIILEPDALALSCGESTESLIAYAVSSLRQNPSVAVYIDGGHSNWVSAGEMAGRLRNAGVDQATGFAVNVSNFQPTDALIDYGRSLSGLLGGKPFVIDTSRNGQGPRGAEWCNPAGAGLGEAPTAATGDDAVHALLWVKRPGESDGACGQCADTPAGQFCTRYALELARNAAF